MDGHTENLERVKTTIGDTVLAFVKQCFDENKAFHISELQSYVSSRVQSAPNSAYRILYQLKRDKKCNYKLLSRLKSHYVIDWVAA